MNLGTIVKIDENLIMIFSHAKACFYEEFQQCEEMLILMNLVLPDRSLARNTKNHTDENRSCTDA